MGQSIQTMQRFYKNHACINTNQLDYEFNLHDSLLTDTESSLENDNSNNNMLYTYLEDDFFSDDDSFSIEMERLTTIRDVTASDTNNSTNHSYTSFTSSPTNHTSLANHTYIPFTSPPIYPSKIQSHMSIK